MLQLFTPLLKLLPLGVAEVHIRQLGCDSRELIHQFFLGRGATPDQGLLPFDVLQQAVAVEPGEQGQRGPGRSFGYKRVGSLPGNAESLDLLLPPGLWQQGSFALEKEGFGGDATTQ